MDTWLIGVTVGSGVVFEGTREEAQEHMNKYVAYLEQMFSEKKLAFLRKEHTIRLKGSVEPDDESLDANASTNGNGLFT